MKSSLITLFLVLATTIHAGVTGNLRIRARLDNEAERAAGMAGAVTPEYKKAHGVTPELEAMILADGAGGQGTNSYYESFAPVNPTKKQVEINSHDDLVIPINPQPLGHTVATVISSIIATGGITVTSAASSTVTTAATWKISICTSQEHPSWIPPLIRPTAAESVKLPTPSRSPITTITMTLTTLTTTLTPLPTGTGTISHIPSSNPVSTAMLHPTSSFVSTTPITSGTSDGPVRTSAFIPVPTEHPSDAPAEAALDPIPKISSSHVSFAGPYPASTAGHEVGTVSVYPTPTSNSTTIIPTVIPPTTLVTRTRDLTTTISQAIIQWE